MNKEAIHAYREAALDLIHAIPPLHVSNKARYGFNFSLKPYQLNHVLCIRLIKADSSAAPPLSLKADKWPKWFVLALLFHHFVISWTLARFVNILCLIWIYYTHLAAPVQFGFTSLIALRHSSSRGNIYHLALPDGLNVLCSFFQNE